MNPLIAAALISAGVQAVGGGVSAAGRIDRLTDAEKKRKKELERLTGLDLLGLDDSQKQAIYSQQLHPVQAAEREAMAKAAQRQVIGDIGQGASFRQQQAMSEAAMEARTRAATAAHQQILEKEQVHEAKQLAERQLQLQELAALEAQKAQNRQAIFDILGGGIVGAGSIGSAAVLTKKESENEKAMLEAKKSIAEDVSGESVSQESIYTNAIYDQIGLPPQQGLGTEQANAFELDLLEAGLHPRYTPTEPMVPSPETILPMTSDAVGTFVPQFKGATYGYQVAEIDAAGNPTKFIWVGSKGAGTEFTPSSNPQVFDEAMTLWRGQ